MFTVVEYPERLCPCWEISITRYEGVILSADLANVDATPD